MKRKIASSAAILTLVCGALAAGGGTAWAGQGKYMIKNAATGRCMKAGSNGATTAVAMVTCNRNDQAQWWAPSGNHIYAPNASVLSNDVCLVVATNNVPGDVASGACGVSGFKSVLTYAVGSGYSISPSGTPGGYVSDPGTSYTWAVNDEWEGNNSKWNWLS